MMAEYYWLRNGYLSILPLENFSLEMSNMFDLINFTWTVICVGNSSKCTHIYQRDVGIAAMCATHNQT